MSEKFRYKESDFSDYIQPYRGFLAAKANAILDAHLKTLKVYYTATQWSPMSFYTEFHVRDTTHKALVWSIEPIEVKVCKHFPDRNKNDRCVHCGKKLSPKVTWVVADE